MRDILNLLDSVVTEGVGLANRNPGDLYKNAQGDVIEFQSLNFYPDLGKFDSEEELAQAVDQINQQHNIKWVNTYNYKKHGAFAIATFTDQTGKEYYLGKFLPEIMANRRDNKFAHDEMPGGFKYATGRGASENAGYQPSQVLTQFDNNTPESIADQIIAKFGPDSDEARAVELFVAAKDFPVTIPAGNMNYNAFSVYFCEMLQPIAFVKGMTVKGNAQECVDLYFGPGQTMVGSTIGFNSGKGGLLSDSRLTNADGNSINISTKNATGGAKASAQNLRIEFDKLKSTPKGAKLLKKHESALQIINFFDGDAHYSAPLEIATMAKIITPQEAQQIMTLKNSKLGLGQDPGKILSPKLMEWYNAHLAAWKKPVVPIHAIMLIIAKRVVDYVNNKTNFSSAASEILNNGALIQVNTMIKKSGENFIFEGLQSHYPSQAVTGVLLSTEKAYWNTGAQGNMPFKILFNGAKPEKETDIDVDGAETKAPAKTTAQDLDTVGKQRSKVKASAVGVEKDKKFSKKALGRDYQR